MNHLIQKLAIMIFKQVKQLHKDKTDQLDILDIAKKFIGEIEEKHFLVLIECIKNVTN